MSRRELEREGSQKPEARSESQKPVIGTQK